MAKKKKIEEPKEIPLTQTAKEYINMVEDSICRIEASKDTLSVSEKNYIDALKSNIQRAPDWFKNHKPSYRLAQVFISSGMTDTVILEAAKEDPEKAFKIPSKKTKSK